MSGADRMRQADIRRNRSCDYYPTNFVVREGELFYIDYECNQYMEEWNFENWGVKYWSKTEEFLRSHGG